MILAWPAALEALKAPVRATVVQAQPIGIEDGVIVFGAPRIGFVRLVSGLSGNAGNSVKALEFFPAAADGCRLRASHPASEAQKIAGWA